MDCVPEENNCNMYIEAHNVTESVLWHIKFETQSIDWFSI